MADIQDFIQMAMSNLGTSEETVSAATGGLLGILKDNVAGGDFDQLLGALPGAEGLLGGGSSSGGGGLLGGLVSQAASSLAGVPVVQEAG